MADPIEIEVQFKIREAKQKLRELQAELHELRGGTDAASEGMETAGNALDGLGDSLGETNLEAGRLADGLGAMIPIVGNLKTTTEGFANSGLGAVAGGIGALLLILPEAIRLFQALKEEATGGTVSFRNMATSLDDVIARLQRLDQLEDRRARRIRGQQTGLEARAEAFQASQFRGAAQNRFRRAIEAAGLQDRQGELQAAALRGEQLTGGALSRGELAGLGGAGAELLRAARALSEASAAETTALREQERVLRLEEEIARDEANKNKFGTSRGASGFRAPRGGGAEAAAQAGPVNLAQIFAEANGELELFEDLETERIRLLQEEAEAVQALKEAEQDRVAKAKEAEAELLQLRMDALEKEKNARQSMVRKEQELQRQRQQLTEDVVGTSIEAGNMLLSNFGATQGQMELFQGISDAAMAVTKFAGQDFASGALYLLSSGMHIANAAQMGVGGGSAPASAGAAAGGGQRGVRPVAQGGFGAQNAGPQNITINFASPVSDREIGRMQRRANVEWQRRFSNRLGTSPAP